MLLNFMLSTEELNEQKRHTIYTFNRNPFY